MTMNTIRRLAADILKVGELKVKISPDGVKEAEKAMTRSDVRELIKKGIITRAPNLGRRKKERRRRRSAGSRKGTAKTRAGGKAVWMAKVRSQRAFLKQLLAEEAFDKKHKRILYMRIKSGLFRSKRAFLAYLKENGLTKQDYEPKKKEWVPKATRASAKKAEAARPAAESSRSEPLKQKTEAKPKAQGQKPVASTAQAAKATAPTATSGMNPKPEAAPTTSKEANRS
jgi:large subunit ribosomal protein L19e